MNRERYVNVSALRHESKYWQFSQETPYNKIIKSFALCSTVHLGKLLTQPKFTLQTFFVCSFHDGARKIIWRREIWRKLKWRDEKMWPNSNSVNVIMRRRREFYILNCSNTVLTAIVFYSLLIGEWKFIRVNAFEFAHRARSIVSPKKRKVNWEKNLIKNQFRIFQMPKICPSHKQKCLWARLKHLILQEC